MIQVCLTRQLTASPELVFFRQSGEEVKRPCAATFAIRVAAHGWRLLVEGHLGVVGGVAAALGVRGVPQLEEDLDSLGGRLRRDALRAEDVTNLVLGGLVHDAVHDVLLQISGQSFRPHVLSMAGAGEDHKS
jgi:hypothetical protein